MRESLLLLCALLLAACDSTPASDAGPDRVRSDAGPPDAGAVRDAGPGDARSARVLVTSGEPAARSGLLVLAEGGNAMDAALTIALQQIVLTAGSWNSFAGIMGLLYYDAESGEMHALHGGYRTFADELDALSIPETASGRTALVGGFMAALEAAHARFGSVPFERMFQPAIATAEDGFVVDETLSRLFALRQDVLRAHPETRAVYLSDGSVPTTGERFRQPALAATLRAVASEGAAYMYTGEWAARFVDQVSHAGGRVTLADLADYEPSWTRPTCFAYGADEVCTFGAPDVGGVALAESMQVADVVDLRARGDYLESSDALYWLLRAQQTGLLMTYLPELLPEDPTFFTDRLDGVEPSTAARLSRAQAEAMVEHIESGRLDRVVRDWAQAFEASSHSDAIVVADEMGNIVALTHTINTSRWGQTGLNVGGVSVPDSAAFQQGAVYLAGPGAYLPSILNPTFVRRDGRVWLAASTIGSPHFAMFSHLHGVLDLGLSPSEMVARPIVDGTGPYREFVRPGTVDPAVVSGVLARGLPLEVASNPPQAFWLGLSIDASGALDSGVTPALSLIGGGVYGPDLP